MAVSPWRVALVVLACAAPAPFAWASGGGGMGGGTMPSFNGPQYNPVEEYQQGMSDYQSGNFKSAVRHFENVTDAEGHDANAWYMLGMARSRAGRHPSRSGHHPSHAEGNRQGSGRTRRAEHARGGLQ